MLYAGLPFSKHHVLNYSAATSHLHYRYLCHLYLHVLSFETTPSQILQPFVIQTAAQRQTPTERSSKKRFDRTAGGPAFDSSVV